MNNTPIGHEKPSNIKKLMKPHKNILRLVIERPQLHDRSYLGQHLPSSTANTTSELLLSGGGSKTPPDSPPPSSAYERRRSKSYGHYGKGSSRRQSQQSQVHTCIHDRCAVHVQLYYIYNYEVEALSYTINCG